MEDTQDEQFADIKTILGRLIDQASASLRPGERLALEFTEELGPHRRTYRVEREVPVVAASPNAVPVVDPERKAKVQALLRTIEPEFYPLDGYGGGR